MRTNMAALALLILTVCTPAAATQERAVQLWGRFEQAFTAKGQAAPETELTVEFTSTQGKKHTIAGFWDGEQTWRVRFMPTEEGTWKYRTTAKPAAPGLDGQSGMFECRRTAAKANRFLEHGPVRVAASGRYLEHADGTPFFWLGDTVWNGPILSAKDDWTTFLQDRVGKQFTVIQFNAIAPWRTAPTDREGQVAFTGRQNIQLNPKYFQRLDQYMDAINERGLLAAPVLIWALRKDDPGIYLPEEDVLRIVRYQVARYGAHQVVWILAGDNPYRAEGAERWKRVGRAVFGTQPHAPVTTHPTGMNWPWEDWRNEKWLDILGYQSGHGDDAKTLAWIHSGPVAKNWQEKPVRPIINLEPPYEDHLAYQSKKPHSAYNVRRACYWSMLNAPAAGLTYGAHGIWSWQEKAGLPTDHPNTGIARPWREAMALPGSTQMKHLAELFTALPWWQLRPDQGLLASQPGGNDPAAFVAAARSDKGDVAVLYLPLGGEVTLKTEGLAPGLTAEWFDPRTGQRSPVKGTDQRTYRAPDTQDWVLLLRRT
jgi:hypothetical protein